MVHKLRMPFTFLDNSTNTSTVALNFVLWPTESEIFTTSPFTKTVCAQILTWRTPNPHNNLMKEVTVISIVQMRKPRHRECKWFSDSRGAGK